MSKQDDSNACRSCRREFLYAAATGVGAVGAAATAIPFVRAMQPAADTLAASTTEFDVATVEPGMIKAIIWRGQPIFIVHRTPAMLKEINGHDAMLKDPESRAIPEVESAWMTSDTLRSTRAIRPEYLVISAVCTHLGCIPTFKPTPGRKDWGDAVPVDWPGGWLCACHGSLYDLSGRVIKGSPAPFNLHMPPYKYIHDTTVLIG
ncbi:MAG: ubiquinol-cytochrome c reductase iron-sulfur subunit [Mariprofundales bacterium]|nr:ubiquinol-cytochrome c reductase iron-sulfur subunit [Mariprofundales bacterium]